MIIDSPIISGSYAATGSLNQTGNVVITGSLTVTGTINGSITGSITTASYALNAETLDGLDSTSFTTTSSFTAYTSSTDASILSNTQNIVVLNASASSLDSRVTKTEATASSLTTASSSFSTRVTSNEINISSLQSASGSFSTRTTNLETASGSFSTRVSSNESNISSLQTASGSFSTRVTSNESNISALQTASGSFSTRVTSTEGSVSSLNSKTGSYATTSSNAFSGSQVITGSLTVTGQITAQTLNVQQVTSSIVFSSGSNIFGNSVSNTQQFTGSLQVSGSNHYLLGNVGIGTTSPATKLHISNNGAYGIEIDVANEIIQAYNRSTSDYNEIKLYSSNIRFFNGTSSTITERMRITSGGLVGIGTSAPTQKLSVYDGAFAVQSSAAGGAEVWRLTIGTTSQFAMNLGGATGILYSTVSDTSKGQLAIRDGLSDLYPAYSFINDGDTGISNAGGTANTLNFITGGTERIRITSSGNIGIGTTSPLEELHVFNSTTAAATLVRGTDANLASSYMLQHGGGGSRTQFDGTWYMSYGSTETNFGLTPNLGGGLVFWFTSGSTTTNPMTLKRSGDALFSGNVGIGTTSPSGKLDISSGLRTGTTSGLFFGADVDVTTGTRTNDTRKLGLISSPHYSSATRPVFGIALDNQVSNNFIYIGGAYSGYNAATVIAFSTGATTTTETGTERMRITSGGNVGIGTTSPSEILHLRDTTNGYTGLRLEGNGNYAGSDWTIYASSLSAPSADDFLGFYNNSTTDGATAEYKFRLFKTGAATFSSSVTAGGDVTLSGNESYLYFTSTYLVGSNTRAKIRTVGAGGGSGYGGDLRFSTRNSSNVWNEDAMTINSAGNVGIGTTSPNNIFTIYAASSAIYTQWIQSGTGTTSTDGLRIGLDASSNGIIDLNEGTALITNVNGSERMRITSGGNVGIGTTAPGAKLQVYGNMQIYAGSSGNSDPLCFGGETGASKKAIFLENFWMVYQGHDNEGHKFRSVSAGGAGTDDMVITGGGNVGIGTTSPSERLEINGSIRLNDGNADGPQVKLASSGYSDWNIDNFSGNFRAYYGSTEIMRITSGGNVGIGLTNPLATLATLGGAVQFMGDYRNYATIIKSAGANGTFNGQLTITIPQMSNAASDGYGGYSCEVYVSGFSGIYCHVWFSGYINGGITPGEATILRSNGGWSISQSSFGANNQGFQFVINYPDALIHPTARIIFNKGGSPNATAYPANEITTVWS